MIMNLDYEFELDGKNYRGIGVDIGDTCELEEEAKDVEGLKLSAICHEFDLTCDGGEEEAKAYELLANAKFNYCELALDF